MIKNPLVSIIIPVYNGSNFVKEAIDSALNQTYKNIEIIVVNDGSTDEGKTEDVCRSYGDKIRYYLKENGGVSSALNFGIRNMRGEYFSWLSHDDMYTETKIEKQVERLVSGADVIVCSERQIDKDGNFLSEQNDYSHIEGKTIDWQEEMINIIAGKLFSGCALLIPKYAFNMVGLFDETLRYNQDFDMWIKFCLANYSWKYSNEIGVLSRVHSNQVTQTRRDLFFKDSYNLGKRLIPELEKVSTKENNFLYYYALNCAKYDLKKNLKLCKECSKNRRLFSLKHRVKISMISLYGKIRPAIRKLYYKIFKKVKTQ